MSECICYSVNGDNPECTFHDLRVTRDDILDALEGKQELVDPVMAGVIAALLIQALVKLLGSKEKASDALLRQEAVDAANLGADAIELARGLK
jgi:hypothetical protein